MVSEYLLQTAITTKSVLILVLVEDGLGALGMQSTLLRAVLILVLVEDGLGEQIVASLISDDSRS